MIAFVTVLILQAITSRGLQAPRMVYPRLLQERAADGRLLLHIHDALTLKLEKASIAAPNLYVHKQEAGSPVVERLNGQDFNNILYQDEENFATVTLRETEEAVQVVKLRFSKMTEPKVRLLLVGVEKITMKPFMHIQSGYLHASKTVAKLRLHAAQGKKTKYQHTDVLFYITGRDIANKDGKGKLSSAVQGIAYGSGLCTAFFVGLGEDTAGYYTGVRTIAHEIGHLLGAQHDGDGPDTFIDGHPGARNCPFSDGYLMSYVIKGPKQHLFSKCSLEQMQFVISARGEACWNVESKKRLYVVGKYPGMMVNVNESCQRIFHEKPNVTAEMVLYNGNECKVRCQYIEASIVNQNGKTYLKTRTFSREVEALDYTSCEQGKVCIQGVCKTPKLATATPANKASNNVQKSR